MLQKFVQNSDTLVKDANCVWLQNFPIVGSLYSLLHTT